MTTKTAFTILSKQADELETESSWLARLLSYFYKPPKKKTKIKYQQVHYDDCWEFRQKGIISDSIQVHGFDQYGNVLKHHDLYITDEFVIIRWKKETIGLVFYDAYC